ncbi:unnamed protein product, partial [Prorocentrum cordatum]
MERLRPTVDFEANVARAATRIAVGCTALVGSNMGAISGRAGLSAMWGPAQRPPPLHPLLQRRLSRDCSSPGTVQPLRHGHEGSPRSSARERPLRGRPRCPALPSATRCRCTRRRTTGSSAGEAPSTTCALAAPGPLARPAAAAPSTARRPRGRPPWRRSPSSTWCWSSARNREPCRRRARRRTARWAALRRCGSGRVREARAPPLARSRPGPWSA